MRLDRRRRWCTSTLAVAAVAAGLTTGCGATSNPSPGPPAAAAATSSTTAGLPIEVPPTTIDTGTGVLEAPEGQVPGRPPWLGTRILPPGPDGYGEIQPTPPELVDRRLPTVDLLAPPDHDSFASTVGPVPDDVARRSTWDPACPVGLEDLRYLTVSFWGFDQRPHTGELMVSASAAGDVVEAFRRLYQVRFPIEEMRVTQASELDAPPTGDGNNTSAFVCRPSRGTTSWSEHAYGRAVDINPFHNPYVKGALVLPELASAYAERGQRRPGMVEAGDVVTTTFAELGWGWGGAWRSSKDYMHFSVSGR